VRIPFTDLRAMHEEVRTEIEAAWRDIIDRSAFVGGPAVTSFERAFADYCGADHCVGVGSGTDALRIALQAVGVNAGELVVTVSQTFIATVEAITQSGAAPVFVDVEPVTYTMDPDRVRDYLERGCLVRQGQLFDRLNGRRVVCLLPVDLYGQPADYERLLALAAHYDLRVVEDACQAHGARYDGRVCGTFGDVSAFSFYPGKNLGAMGEAGAIVTSDEAIARQCRILREHGQRDRYIHVTGAGSNARLDALQAVVLAAKLERLPRWNEARRRVVGWYRERLAGFDLVLPRERAGSQHVYHLFVVLTKDRERVRRALEARGIATGLHYPVPLHQQDAYRDVEYARGPLTVSERVSNEGLSLPMFPHMTRSQVDAVGDALDGVLQTVGP